MILVIGIGNAYRGDDAVGLVVARRLQEQVPAGVIVVEHSGEGASLMDAWRDADRVILIDAVHTGAAPGTLCRLDARAGPLPAHFFHCSTHAFSVAEAVELARALDRLPLRLIVHGIEGARFEAGTGVSPEVERAVEVAVQRVREDLCTNSP
jgi:hydrogenase maturation protease